MDLICSGDIGGAMLLCARLGIPVREHILIKALWDYIPPDTVFIARGMYDGNESVTVFDSIMNAFDHLVQPIPVSVERFKLSIVIHSDSLNDPKEVILNNYMFLMFEHRRVCYYSLNFHPYRQEFNIQFEIDLDEFKLDVGNYLNFTTRIKKEYYIIDGIAHSITHP